LIAQSSSPWSDNSPTSLRRPLGDASLSGRNWVLLTEAVDGGWGLAGHANTNADLIVAARAQMAKLDA
jgi:hypothetical protein